MEAITSPHNPKIKLARALRQRKARLESGLFLVEGIRPVGEAIQAGAPLEFLLYSPQLLESDFAWQLIREQERQGMPCYPVDAPLFTSLADKENPQGILAVVRAQPADLAQLTPTRFPWGVALVAPQDPGNVGSILRTVDAVGASGLILLEASVDAYHPSAVRASMGALFWHPVAQAPFGEFLAWARRHHYHLYGTSAHAPLDYRQVERYERPCLLLLGSEREGLTPEQAAHCERLIRLPMKGRASSLNLAVAAGVMLYAMLERFEAEQAGT